MKSTSFLLALFALASAVSVAFSAENPPNVVVIVADDLGYGETGMMGNREIPTPQIDALAASGVRCTAGYVTSSYCSPSRAGLMTGRYQSRFGYDINPTGKRNLLPGAGLPLSETTFVKKLDDAGYQTALIGKWHLGATEPMHPLSRGFDRFYGFLHEGHFYVPGPPHQNVLTMIRDNSLAAGTRVRKGNLIRGNYARISEPAYDQDNPILRGRDVIEESRYLTEAITEEAVDFLDQHHQDPFCLMVCYNAVHSPMQAELDDVEALRRIQDVQRRIFAGMLVALDRGVGAITAAIDEHRLRRETLIVFLSDNGGPTEELTSSNAPLRGGKGTLYEGGVRVPMVWSFLGRLPEGKTEPRPVLSLDIAATALHLAGLPADPSSDGKCLFDWINDPIAKGHETIFWRMPGGKQALRSGDWKIVRPKHGEPLELYHLASDLEEERNLSGKQTDKLKELTNRWLAINSQMADLDR
ncbi:sulfatase-like hydrolase/transferase [Roseiconus nitratireducens]|uniref:Sulfatase-like hydrolase/transferase n=1 Tax=Roseiconus nitratireducens TaxID=2605748 RepID=A0A5M6DLC1_9BACT|nr:sulfatase-like hydrolase/transferase [Roseiconus nitratireducens]KAA5547052.1 sulfatase-like hydrolase/transferase [Roseiconus nitratireducens]